MHWFWRAAIAVVGGVVVGFAASLGTGYLMDYAVRSGWIAMPTSSSGDSLLFLFVVFSLRAFEVALACTVSLTVYGALTKKLAKAGEDDASTAAAT